MTLDCERFNLSLPMAQKQEIEKSHSETRNIFAPSKVGTRIIAYLLRHEMLVCNIPSLILPLFQYCKSPIQYVYYPHTSTIPTLCEMDIPSMEHLSPPNTTVSAGSLSSNMLHSHVMQHLQSVLGFPYVDAQLFLVQKLGTTVNTRARTTVTATHLLGFAWQTCCFCPPARCHLSGFQLLCINVIILYSLHDSKLKRKS